MTGKPKALCTAVLSICLALSAAQAAPETKARFHRKPLLAGKFATLPLGSVKPRGWLKRELQIQADGITGHMDEFYHLLTKNGWLGVKGPKFNSYQWAPYYLDGLVPLAHLLDDQRLKAKAAKWLDWTLTNTHEDGWIGPPPEQCYRPWGSGTRRRCSRPWFSTPRPPATNA